MAKKDPKPNQPPRQDSRTSKRRSRSKLGELGNDMNKDPRFEILLQPARERPDMDKNPNFHLVQGWVSSFSPEPNPLRQLSTPG